MMIALLSLVHILLLALPSNALTSAQMRPRTIYQVLTDRYARTDLSTSASCSTSARAYCGGTWAGLAAKLDYIQGMGFDTVWISPIVQNIGGTTGEGQAYHGYWALDISQLNSNFGSAQDLINLSSALHSRGMYLMVDIVVNHVGATSSSTFQTSNSYGPFNAQSDFHPFCWISDYNNQNNVEQCWLGDSTVALPDINTEASNVVAYFNTWIKNLISTYSIDAIRIDTVKHVSKNFWPGFTAAAGVYNLGEIFHGDPAYVGPYQASSVGINPINYPIYYPLYRAFSGGGSLSDLVSMVSSVKNAFADPTLLGTFISNHDNPTFESYTSDSSLIKNGHAYTMVTDGIPIVYYGSEDGYNGGNDPANRPALWLSGYTTSNPMYSFFGQLNAARRAAANASSAFYTSQMSVTSLSGNEILVAKQPLVSVLSNRGSATSNVTVTLPSSQTGWSYNTYIIDTLTCQTFQTDSSGNLSVYLLNGLPRVLIGFAMRGNVCKSTTVVTDPGDHGRLSLGTIGVRAFGSDQWNYFTGEV